jgi:hypothetical protein
MDETDAFFTQTVVGPPFTVMMGRRRSHAGPDREGLSANLQTGESRLTQMWMDWVVLSHACDPVGQPRLRPGRVRRILERHALWLAVVGLSALLATLGFWGVQRWI